MLLDNSTDSKIRALHRVLICARTQAYSGMSRETLARVLDDAEYLATRIFAPDPNDVGEFRALLEEMEHKYAGFKGLTEAYEEAEAEVVTASGRSIK